MSPAELGRLFPVILSAHDEGWAALYEAERELLLAAAGAANVARVSHYGSTAVPGLLAKPTIDILLEIKEGAGGAALITAMKGAGYSYAPQPSDPPPHMMFMKGYSPEGFLGQAFHVHVRYPGDWPELHFRDYLLSSPETAAAYAELKRGLQARYRNDREAYTAGKTDFIKAATRRALAAGI